MFLNSNFDPCIESTILLNKQLTDWFERNQEYMAYFELTHPGCLHFEGSSASYDIIVLGRMTDAALTWLDIRNPLPIEEKAENAVKAIMKIYELEKDHLSDTAKQLYTINAEYIEKDDNQDKPFVKVLAKNGIKNRRPGKGHRNH